MMKHMLTTFDNPHDPFNDFPGWLAFDRLHSYNTIELLARVTITSRELSMADESLANETAIDEIVSENVLGIYRKVSKDVLDDKYDT